MLGCPSRGCDTKTVYWLNAALLAAHEVDSGYWREWELFALPGGSSLFVALHVPIFLLLLWGYEQVVAGRRAGVVMSLALAASGIFALGLHGAFLAAGRAQFRDPVSLIVLACLGFTSLVQAGVAGGRLRAGRPAARPRASAGPG